MRKKGSDLERVRASLARGYDARHIAVNLDLTIGVVRDLIARLSAEKKNAPGVVDNNVFRFRDAKAAAKVVMRTGSEINFRDAKAAEKTSAGKSFSDWRSQHDCRFKIEEVLRKTFRFKSEEDPGVYLEDFEMRELCNIAPHDWRRYAAAFAQYQLKIRDKHYWAHPKMIELMKRITGRAI